MVKIRLSSFVKVETAFDVAFWRSDVGGLAGLILPDDPAWRSQARFTLGCYDSHLWCGLGWAGLGWLTVFVVEVVFGRAPK